MRTERDRSCGERRCMHEGPSGLLKRASKCRGRPIFGARRNGERQDVLGPAGAMGRAGERRRAQEGPSAAYSGALRKSPQTAIFGGPAFPATPRHMRANQESVQRCAALDAGNAAPETAAEGPSCAHLRSLMGLCGASARGLRALKSICGRTQGFLHVHVRAELAHGSAGACGVHVFHPDSVTLVEW